MSVKSTQHNLLALSPIKRSAPAPQPLCPTFFSCNIRSQYRTNYTHLIHHNQRTRSEKVQPACDTKGIDIKKGDMNEGPILREYTRDSPIYILKIFTTKWYTFTCTQKSWTGGPSHEVQYNYYIYIQTLLMFLAACREESAAIPRTPHSRHDVITVLD